MNKTVQNFIEKLDKEELYITKVVGYPFKIYFTLGNERYLYGNGFEYSMLALEDKEKRKVLEFIAEDMLFPINCLFLKNEEKFNTQKGMTYSYIDTDKFKRQLLYYIKGEKCETI